MDPCYFHSSSVNVVQLSISTYGILQTGKNCEAALVASSTDFLRQCFDLRKTFNRLLNTYLQQLMRPEDFNPFVN